nr:MAG TPA: hypothetical protein [Caudoviricetes sp.]
MIQPFIILYNESRRDELSFHSLVRVSRPKV